MGGGRLRPVLLLGKNIKFRAGYIGMRAGIGREEIDISLEENH